MKFMAILSSTVAVASAQWPLGLVAHPNGAVEPAVVAARADHLAAKGLPVAPIAAALPGTITPALPALAPAAAWTGYAAGWPAAGAWAGYGAPWGLVAHPNGAVVPADEPAVVAARADHLAAHGLPVAPIAGPAVYAAGFPGLVAPPNGALVPAEPADVVAARADHLAALAEA